MDTKSRKLSRSKGLKVAAFVLACLAFAGACAEFAVIFRNAADLEMFDPSAVLTDEYVESQTFDDETRYILYLLGDLLDSYWTAPVSSHYIDTRAVYYVASDGGDVASNCAYSTAAEFRQVSSVYLIIENGQLVDSTLQGSYNNTSSASGTITDTTLQTNYNNALVTVRSEGYTLYLAFLPEYLSAGQQSWNEVRSVIFPGVWFCIPSLVFALILVIYLIAVTGRKPGSGEVTLGLLGRVYSDILAVIIVSGTVWLAHMMVEMFANRYDTYYFRNLGPLITALFCFVFFAVLLALLLAFIRKLKARIVLKHSLVYTICHKVWRLVTGVFRVIGNFFNQLFSARIFKMPFSKTMHRRQLIFMLTSALITMFFMISALSYSLTWSLLFVVFELMLVYFYTKNSNRTFHDMEQICMQIDAMTNGYLDFVPQIGRNSQLYNTSVDLQNIGQGMQKALDKQLSSERMKISLITNVSHDLKTPLTSIIGYIDLLSRDDTLSAEGRDYVTVLMQKANRLKSIVEDLFDLAKTTSGSAELVFETLELRRLVEQTLGDMADKIEQSGRAIRKVMPTEPVYISGDGRKLYRVMQNVIDNALKYSMPGTRIFIRVECDEAHARVTFKNTAGYEMDFTADEIIERFARGDKSRTTEGSGLGLSIADGFIRANGGELTVSIDGDQFAVVLSFPMVPPPVESEPDGPDGAVVEPAPLAHIDEVLTMPGELYTPAQDEPPPELRIEADMPPQDEPVEADMPPQDDTDLQE